MTTWVFGSARSSPGATTTALAVASCVAGAVLVEADVDGGQLAVRYGLGREPGLATLAGVRVGLSADLVRSHAQALPGGLAVLVGPDSPARAELLWRSAGARLASGLAALAETVVVADAGRLGPASAGRLLAPSASIVAVVARPEAAELLAAAERARELAELAPVVGLVLVGDGPHRSGEVERQLGCQVLGIVADDRRAAEGLLGGSGRRSLARSALARSARQLAEDLLARTTAAHPLPGLEVAP